MKKNLDFRLVQKYWCFIATGKSQNFDFLRNKQKKIFAVILFLPIEEISLRPELSNPLCFRIHPERNKQTKDEGQTEILVSNIGFMRSQDSEN